METDEADCVIIGGGISGIVTALELLDSNLKILLIDRDGYDNLGGLAKEFVISGAEHNEAIRENKIVPFLFNLLFGNKKLVNRMIRDCEDFVVAHSIEELAEKMNLLSGDNIVDVNSFCPEKAWVVFRQIWNAG